MPLTARLGKLAASITEGAEQMAAQTTNGGRGGNSWVTGAWITVTALLLLTPLVAMQFSDEVNWTVSDFAFAGGILVVSGIIYELAARVGNLAYQAAVVLALGASVLSLWVTGAVGIIGDEGNPGNLLYLGVVALAIVGAIIARGRAANMSWAMAVVALAEILAPVVAYFSIANPRAAVLAPEVYAATGVLAAMWLASAWLFQKAAQS
jgi:hypothetical protein